VADHSGNFVILACIVLIGLRGVTDRRTDRPHDDSYSKMRLAHLSRIKSSVCHCVMLHTVVLDR